MAGISLVLAGAGAWVATRALRHPRESVRLAVTHDEGSALVWIADERGDFAKEGLDVTVVELPSQEEAFRWLRQGLAPLAVVADTTLAKEALERQRFSILSTIYSSKGNIKLLARKDHGIHRPGDLKGKRVGVAAGANREYFLASFMLRFGLEPQDLQVVTESPAQLENDFETGKLDAACVQAPHAFHTQKNLGANAVSFSESLIYEDGLNLVAAEEWLAQETPAAKRVLKALLRAEKASATHREEALRIVVAKSGLEREYLVQAWADSDYSLRLDQGLLVRLEERARWLRRKRGEGRLSPDFVNYIDYHPLKAILPERVGIIH